MENVKNCLANKIRFVRELQGYSQESLAAYIGISQQAYQKMESGKCRICEERLQSIAQYFDLEAAQIRSLNKAELLACIENQKNLANRLKLKAEILSIKKQLDALSLMNEKVLKELNETIDPSQT